MASSVLTSFPESPGPFAKFCPGELVCKMPNIFIWNASL